MPPKLPKVSGEGAIRSLKRSDFVVVRQRGSHVILRNGSRGCVIPLHRELAVGTLHSALSQAGVTVEELNKNLERKTLIARDGIAENYNPKGTK